MSLPSNEIESELSYAYLHAVVSKAGMNCKVENRHGDNYGVDAIIDYYDKIPDTYRTDVTLRVQLKATTQKGTETENHRSYFFRGIEQYDKLRANRGEPHRILIVLFLPQNDSEWLDCTTDQLILKYSAYWVCLYDAPKSKNETGETIYFPKANLLTPKSLIKLCQDIGQNQIPTYQLP